MMGYTVVFGFADGAVIPGYRDCDMAWVLDYLDSGDDLNIQCHYRFFTAIA